MTKIYGSLTLCILTLLLIKPAKAQFYPVEDAFIISDGCAQLTYDSSAQRGAIWSQQRLDLDTAFDFYFIMNFGCTDAGADGIAFVLHQDPRDSAAIGGEGAALGYMVGPPAGTVKIAPSIVVEFDTYDNTSAANDIADDHISIQKDGSYAPADALAGPVPVTSTSSNIEDCLNHEVRITWDPIQDSFKVYFDCELRIAYGGDIRQDGGFSSDNIVWWGFTSATATAKNRHTVCWTDSAVSTTSLDTSICSADTIALMAPPAAKYTWTPAYEISRTDSQVARVSPDVDTQYVVAYEKMCGAVTSSDTFNIKTTRDLLGADTTVCFMDSFQLTTLSPQPNYLWSTSETRDTIYVKQPGKYYVNVTDGSCTFTDSIVISDKRVGFSLGADTAICSGDSLLLTPGIPYNLITWSTSQFGDTIYVQQPDTYWVEVVDTNNCITLDSLVLNQITNSIIDLRNDTAICEGDSVLLRVDSSGLSYQWSTSETTQEIYAKDSGLYIVDVTINGCTVTDSFHLDYTTFSISLSADTTICFGDSVALTPGPGYSSYTWSTAETTDTIYADSSGTYWVEVVQSGNCSASDTIVVTVGGSFSLFLGNDTTICVGDSIALGVDTSGLTYLWSTSETTDSIIIKDSGLVWVQVTDTNNCVRSDTIRILFPPSQVSLGSDTTLCFGDSVALSPGPGFTSYSWSTGETTDTIYVKAKDTVWVDATSGVCTSRDSVIVNVGEEYTLDLGPDTTICPGFSIALVADSGATSYTWSTGLMNDSLIVFQTDTYSVVATFGAGCTATDSVIVTLSSEDTLSLGADTSFCSGSITLDAGPYPTVVWQDTLAQQQLLVAHAGQYQVRVTDSAGCQFRDTINVGLFDAFSFTQSELLSLCPGQAIRLQVPGYPGVTYTWNTGISDTFIDIISPGNYEVTTNVCDTTYIKEFKVELPLVDVGRLFFIPNAFSPILGDSTNDNFVIVVNPEMATVEEFSIIIANRWGEIMYRSEDIALPWNGMYKGKVVQPGIYAYTVRLRLLMPCIGEQAFTVNGNVTVL